MPNRYGVILLAAGLSTRFAQGDKLLYPWQGRPLLCFAADAVRAAPCAARIAVIGPGDRAKRELLEAVGIPCTANPQPVDGMGSSIAIGARALPADLDGMFVVLGDMPALPVDIFEVLAATLEAGVCTIAAPSHRGQRGHPVLFGRPHLPALRLLDGDQGARAILQDAAATTRLLSVADSGVLRDFDTVEAFALGTAARKR